MRATSTKSTRLSTADAATALLGERLRLRGCLYGANLAARRARVGSVPAWGNDAPPSTTSV